MTKILTTTESDLPKSYMYDTEVNVLPLRLWFGNNNYKELVNLSSEDFYYKLSKFGVSPRIVHPSPSTIYQSLKDDVEFSMVIAPSSMFSKFYQTTILVKTKYHFKNCIIIDTGCISMGIGALALMARKMCKENWDNKEILESINLAKEKTIVFGISSKINKKISPTNFLKNKGKQKILNYNLVSQFLGGKKMTQMIKMKDVSQNIIKLLKKQFDKTQPIFCSILSSGNKDETFHLSELLTNNFNVIEIVESKVGALLASHIGNKSIAVAVSPFVNL